MTQNRYYTNEGQATFLANASGINNIENDVYTDSSTNWPLVYPFVLSVDFGTLNEELLLVTSGSGTLGAPYIVTRGYDGTTAQPHNFGSVVVPKICQLDFAEPQQHLNLTGSGSGAHGLPASAWLGGQYQLIQKQIMGSTTASVTFSTATFATIPAACNNLMVYIATKTAYTSANVELLQVQINGYTGANYGNTYVQTNGTTIVAKSDVAKTQGSCGVCWTSNSGASTVGRTILTFPFYNEAHWAKGYDFYSAGTDTVTSGNSYSNTGGGACSQVTAAINQLLFFPQFTVSSGFLANSIFALYAY
jgi:hypothetical protein